MVVVVDVLVAAKELVEVIIGPPDACIGIVEVVVVVGGVHCPKVSH